MSDDFQVADLLQQGIAAVKAGQSEEARQLLMQVVELDERSEQGWLWLSGVVENPEDRRVCLENVLAINPNNEHARTGLQWLDQHQPKPDAAQDSCPRCQAALPPSGSECPHCRLPLIISCPGCSEYVEVDHATCPSCGHALGDFHQGAGYHLEMAKAYFARSRMDRTQEALVRAEAEAGDDPEVWVGLASIYAELGRADKAITAYERAIEIDPARASLYAGLAAIYRQRGQTDQAQSLYDKAAELAGDDPNALCSLARAYLAEDERTEALHCLERALKIQPKSAEAHLILGDAYRSQDRLDRALRLYETAYKLAPKDSGLSQEAQTKLGQVQAVLRHEAAAPRASRGGGASYRPQKRPGCITAYAVLLGISGLFSLLGVIAIIGFMGTGRDMLAEAFEMAGPAVSVNLDAITAAMGIYVVFALVMAALNLAIAAGLWFLKNWARILVIIINSLNLLLSLIYGVIQLVAFQAVTAGYGSTNAGLFVAIPILINLLIQAIIIFWFTINRDLFS